LGPPGVLLGHAAPFCNQFVNVETDDLLASYAVTQHLLKLGHKRIAFFAGPLATPWTEERFEGYCRALREAGLVVCRKEGLRVYYQLREPRLSQVLDEIHALTQSGDKR